MPGARVSVTSLLLFCALALPASSQTEAQPELAVQIRELSALLKETQAELQQHRGEIERLRSEVAALRGELHAASQVPPSAASDGDQSITQKVDSLEGDQELLKGKVDDQYQTKVESGSRYRVKLSGLLLTNFSSTTGRVNDIDVPNVAGGLTLDSGGTFSGSVRQSEISLNVDGPTWLGARTNAAVTFDFFGGISRIANGSDFGIARLKTGYARFDWEQTSVEIGQTAPLISPLSPTSFASLSIPALGYSGNLWGWTPQLSVEHRWNGEHWGYSLQAGLIDPLAGQNSGYAYARVPQAGEASRQPALVARNSLSRMMAGRKMTLGIGGYYSRRNYGFDRNIDGWAGTADWKIPLTKWLELSGEAYRGRAIGALWGSTGVSVITSGSLLLPATGVNGLNTIGGWSQLKFRATSKLEFNGAYGQDNPFGRDLRSFFNPIAYQFVARNQTVMLNVVDHPRSNLILSLEYRHLNTAWTSATPDTAAHINASVGVLF